MEGRVEAPEQQQVEKTDRNGNGTMQTGGQRDAQGIAREWRKG